MDHPKYNSLMDALTALPDPRKARGKQLEWPFIWGIIATAMVSSQRGAAAIAHWATRHAPALLAAFQPAKGRLPSESTIRRALQQVDVSALERQIAALDQAPASPPEPSPSPFQGYAIDGKHIRGAAAHGQPTLLVSLVAHGDARVVAQTAVASKRHESHAVPALLAGRDLCGVVVTMDAGLTQAALARQIRAQGGHYLMVVKRNRHQLYDELTTFFSTAPQPCDRPWRTASMSNKGHGRLETRTLRCTDELDGYLEWPDVCQVMERECERIELKTGVVTRAVTYAATSLTGEEVTPQELAGFWREHWVIENRRHYVRDVTMGEDGCQMHVSSAPQALAALRNGVISLLRRDGWTNIAAGLRHYGASVIDALRFVGVPVSGL